MPRFDIVFVDPLAFVDEGFPELAQATTVAREAGRSRASLRIPKLSVVREWLTPSTRARLEVWLRDNQRNDAYRVLSERRFDALRPEIVRRLHNVARRAQAASVAVLTLDEGWAAELHRTYPGLPLLRFEGRRVRTWFGRLPEPTPEPAPRVARPTPLRALDDGPAVDRAPPEEGEALGGEHRGGRLGKRLAAGGEGWIHAFAHPRFGPHTHVCKIFKRPSAWRRAKLERMLAVEPRPLGVAWPQALLFDGDDRWLGYLQPKLAGVELQQVLQRVWKAEPPTRAQLVRYARRALARVAAVHAVGARVGDVQPKNFLVTADDELFLLDADSFQFDGYPCPVGIVEYLHPELLGRDLKKLLRTDAHERFAVATLVFQIFMGRQAPYAHVGGGTPLENQRKARFPYRRGLGGLALVPQGPDGASARMWSHLPYELRRAFTRAFDAHEAPTIEAWAALLADYERELERGRYSNDAIPSGRLTPWRRARRAPR
jgi:hypothetical protein